MVRIFLAYFNDLKIPITFKSQLKCIMGKQAKFPPFYFFLVCCCQLAKLCLTLLRPQRLQPLRPLSPWGFPGKNTAVGCHTLLQGIFPTQRLNLSLTLLCWQEGSLPPVTPGKPIYSMTLLSLYKVLEQVKLSCGQRNLVSSCLLGGRGLIQRARGNFLEVMEIFCICLRRWLQRWI